MLFVQKKLSPCGGDVVYIHCMKKRGSDYMYVFFVFFLLVKKDVDRLADSHIILFL